MFIVLYKNSNEIVIYLHFWKKETETESERENELKEKWESLNSFFRTSHLHTWRKKNVERRKWHMEAQSIKDKTLKCQKWTQWNKNCISKPTSFRAGAMRNECSVNDSWTRWYIFFFFAFRRSWNKKHVDYFYATQNSIVIYGEMHECDVSHMIENIFEWILTKVN